MVGIARTLLFAALLLGSQALAAQTQKCHDKGVCGGGSCTATAPSAGTIDCTGATLIAIKVSAFSAPGSTPTDSSGNTYTCKTNYSSSNRNERWCYALSPTVTNAMTFTVTGLFNALWVSGWDTFDTFDTENGGASAGGSSFTIPSITPSQTGELVLAGFSNADTSAFPVTIDSGFTTQDSQSAGTGEDGVMAYLVDGSAAALGPTWTASAGPLPAAYAQIAFKASGGGGATSCTLASSGWGKC